MPLTAILVLAAGTYLMRAAGPLLAGRFDIPPAVQRLLTVSATVLLAALVATQALFDGAEFAGWARPAGVAVGGLLAWRKAPFLVVVLAAAATTAVLRAVGVR